MYVLNLRGKLLAVCHSGRMNMPIGALCLSTKIWGWWPPGLRGSAPCCVRHIPRCIKQCLMTLQEQQRNSMIWQRRLDTDSGTDNQAALTPRAMSVNTTSTTMTAATAADRAEAPSTKLHCPPSSCPARYATAPPRRMMWPLREQRHIDSVYSYSPVSLTRSSTTLHMPTSSPSTAHIAVTSATKTSDVTSHTVILWWLSCSLRGLNETSLSLSGVTDVGVTLAITDDVTLFYSKTDDALVTVTTLTFSAFQRDRLFSVPANSATKIFRLSLGCHPPGWCHPGGYLVTSLLSSYILRLPSDNIDDSVVCISSAAARPPTNTRLFVLVQSVVQLRQLDSVYSHWCLVDQSARCSV